MNETLSAVSTLESNKDLPVTHLDPFPQQRNGIRVRQLPAIWKANGRTYTLLDRIRNLTLIKAEWTDETTAKTHIMSYEVGFLRIDFPHGKDLNTDNCDKIERQPYSEQWRDGQFWTWTSLAMANAQYNYLAENGKAGVRKYFDSAEYRKTRRESRTAFLKAMGKSS